jgi:uncharacterized membrane protein YfcA
MNPFPSKKFSSFFLTVLLSFSAGVIGGLFGTGGGILIVLLFSRIYKDAQSLDKKDIFAFFVWG